MAIFTSDLLCRIGSIGGNCHAFFKTVEHHHLLGIHSKSNQFLCLCAFAILYFFIVQDCASIDSHSQVSKITPLCARTWKKQGRWKTLSERLQHIDLFITLACAESIKTFLNAVVQALTICKPLLDRYPTNQRDLSGFWSNCTAAGEHNRDLT